MKKQIEDIIWKRVAQEIPTEEATKQILDLFIVSKNEVACCSKCSEPMKRSVAQWVCINQLCSGEVQHDC